MTTYAPQRLLDLRHYLQPITGLPDKDLGIVGDEDHHGGYHHGWSMRAGDGDYSWDESTRDWNSARTEAASGFDLGMFSRLRELSVWLVNECKAGAPDTQDFREIIYSPDGVTVKRWDRMGVRTTGDSSHLTHTHCSFFRDAEKNDKTAVFRRFFEGIDVSTVSDEVWGTSFENPGNPGTTDLASTFLRYANDNAFKANVATQEILKKLASGTATVDIPALVAALTPMLRTIVREELNNTRLGPLNQTTAK